jgi:hypothetical protein
MSDLDRLSPFLRTIGCHLGVRAVDLALATTAVKVGVDNAQRCVALQNKQAEQACLDRR